MQFKRYLQRITARCAKVLVCCCFAPIVALAHNPFDNSVHATLFANELEVSVTLGSEAAHLFVKQAAPDQITSLSGMGLKSLPSNAADVLAEIKSGSETLHATSLQLMGDGLEFAVVAHYPRPSAGDFSFRALYYELAPNLMKLGTFVLEDEAGVQIGSGLLSEGSTTVELKLAAASSPEVVAVSNSAQPTGEALAASASLNTPPTTTLASAPQRPAFSRFVLLGIEHILTGYDHLLFLCALLVVCNRVKPILAIITCFTIAHSITLALAALNVVQLSSRVVEPLIAASIIFVGVENFRGKTDIKTRCLVTLGFGLIHGFGFAGALRESGLSGGGMELVSPLFGFNLGVECGQLAVAVVFLSLLFLARRAPQFERHGTAAVSACVVALGSFWLLQRLFV